jgi:hypothetical protein
MHDSLSLDSPAVQTSAEDALETKQSFQEILRYKLRTVDLVPDLSL